MPLFSVFGLCATPTVVTCHHVAVRANTWQTYKNDGSILFPSLLIKGKERTRKKAQAAAPRKTLASRSTGNWENDERNKEVHLMSYICRIADKISRQPSFSCASVETKTGAIQSRRRQINKLREEEKKATRVAYDILHHFRQQTILRYWASFFLIDDS